MSDYETHRGKMIKVDNPDNHDLKTQCAAILKKLGDEVDDDPVDYLLNHYWGKYIHVDDDLYRILEDEELDFGDSFAHLTYNEDGTISFTSTFYNGGTCLSEMLEEALRKDS